MASFVHITDARLVAAILRTGLRAERTRTGRRGVFCVPVVPNIQTTFQWVRELKGRGYRTAGAVQFSAPDDERVWVGRYGQEPRAVGAARAVALFVSDADTRGWEVVVARGVHRRDIQRARAVPQMAGWRHFPEAKVNGWSNRRVDELMPWRWVPCTPSRTPCPQPGKPQDVIHGPPSILEQAT